MPAWEAFHHDIWLMARGQSSVVLFRGFHRGLRARAIRLGADCAGLRRDADLAAGRDVMDIGGAEGFCAHPSSASDLPGVDPSTVQRISRPLEGSVAA